MSREQDSVAVLLAAAKRLRLGVEGPKIADELEAIATALQAQGADKLKVCGRCLGRGKEDIAHGETKPCDGCDGTGIVKSSHAPTAQMDGAAAVGDGASALWALRQILHDLPDERGWTDPSVEKIARGLVARNPYADLATPSAPEAPCSTHPDAPHGFDRNGSHNAGRYVCDCEGWTPDAATPSAINAPEIDSKSIAAPVGVEGWIVPPQPKWNCGEAVAAWLLNRFPSNSIEAEHGRMLYEWANKLPATPAVSVGDDTARLDYIERTFSGMTNRERYLPVQMIWGKGAGGRTLREACDKYMKRDAALASSVPAIGDA